MKRYLIIAILALASQFPALAQAYDILVLQSRRDQAHEEVLKGFRAGNTSSQRVIVLSDYAGVDIVRIEREDRPLVILALGEEALKVVRQVKKTPVIALMSYDIAPRNNLTGIYMLAPPERYIKKFKAVNARRIGIVHNPAKTGWYLRQVRIAAEKAGIELVIREVSESRESIAKISSLAGKIDLLWMLPDATSVTRETVEAYLHFGQEQAVPVFSFAGSFLGSGAAAVIEIDRYELGRQAGDMATSILLKDTGVKMSFQYPRSTVYKTNPAVTRRFAHAFEGAKD